MQLFKIISLSLTLFFSTSAIQAADVSAEQERHIKAEIKALSDSYGIHRDNNNHDAYANTFTEDGELILYGSVTKGRQDIRARAANASDNARMHIMTTSHIEVIDSHNAIGTQYVTVFSSAKPEGHQEGDVVIEPNYRVMGKYHDKYLLTDEGWKIAERRLEPIFRSTQ